MMLAQTDLPSVPDSTLKWVLIIIVAIVLIACVIYVAINSRRENKLTINDDPAPQFERAPKRYNHEAVAERFGRVESRLRDHDAKFETLQKERHEDDKLAQTRNARLLFALGRIAEKLKVDIEPAE